MAVYAVIQNGVVVNSVEWDGQSNWTPPDSTIIVLAPKTNYFGIGSTWDGTSFIAPAASQTVIL
jgi:hypothetical protein